MPVEQFPNFPEEEEKRRCFGCGLFAKHTVGLPDAAPWEYFEASPAERKSGAVFAHNIPGFGKVSTLPVCVAGTINYPKLIGGIYTTEQLAATPQAQLQALAEKEIMGERHCQTWFPYTVGLRPANHLELQHLRQVEAGRRRFEEEMEQRHREWEDAREESRRAFETRLDEQAEARESERHNWGMWLTVAALLLAVAEVAGTILGLPVVTRLLGLD